MPETNRKKTSRHDQRRQKGQVLVIVVFAITALVAIIGLVVDLGLVFIQYGRLRRAVDAAAIAASLQYRENYTIGSLKTSAAEFLTLNGIPMNADDVDVTVCDLDNQLDSDALPGEELALCDGYGHGNNDGVIEADEGELRKFVHVTAHSGVNLAFLTVIGITHVPLAAEAVSEAASLDVVLVIDRSETVTNGYPVRTPERDPRFCNATNSASGWIGDCEPLNTIKHAAYDFVKDNLFFPYDRVALITFDNHVHTGDDSEAGDPGRRGLYLSHEQNLQTIDGKLVDATVLNRIKQLTAFDPQWDVPSTDDNDLIRSDYLHTAYLGGCDYYPAASSVCRVYEEDYFIPGDWMFLQFCGDTTTCGALPPKDYTTSNIGGALAEAGAEFARPGSRPEALWVVIMIAGSHPNSSIDIAAGSDDNIHCPNPTNSRQPYCTDGNPAVRHCLVTEPDYSQCVARGGTVNEGIYDADDFARDMADFVGVGQQAVLFTIGQGPLVKNCNMCLGVGGTKDNGEQFLKYAADVGNGEYFYAPDPDNLREIFRQIADKINVRLTH